MKILVISQNFYPEIGSGANRIKNLYTQLSKIHDVDVLTTTPTYPNQKMYNDKKYWNEPEINDSSDILRIPMKLKKQSKSMFMRLLYYVELSLKVRVFLMKKQKKYDVVYVTSPNIFLAWVTLFFQKKKTGITRVLEIRDLWPDSVSKIDKINISWIYGFLKYLEGKMYRLADKIVINNEGFRKHIESFSPRTPIFYLPNGLTDQETEAIVKGDEFKVLYTGNIGFAQSLEQLIDVANLLEKAKITFNVIGYGVNAHAFRDYIKMQNFKHVTMYDECSRAEALEQIKQHNVQLSLLKTDDVFMNVLPGKIVDGIGCNTVVVSNIGGYANALLKEYDAGVAIEAGSAEDIVDAIQHIHDNPKEELKYRENMQRLLNDEFLWSKNIYKLNRFLSRDALDNV
ncbi:glycosyltransferase family 4 protein [Aliicoccus persicus]|uniref:Glycosyltransferase involved in cell wall bisynthesis n=1 Tax=Aliicoccus persicus TaxID=930138 RepID=A0A662Z746_9STAP|nr:glycosyltransferase family 4 protein [Aliicoccus persicus]SEW03271.1 Glycosyltransferase involved in cell wall bisynthesis [Aliicoccus persicus]